MAAGTRVRRVAPWKLEVIDEFAGMFERYPVVGVLDIADLPAAQLQQMRQKLRGHAEIVVSKNTLLRLSLERAVERKDPKLRELAEHLRGQSALVFTQMSWFKLNKILRANRMNAPAKPGSRSPKDIVIPAGETDFAPGPVVSELQRVGIKARIQAGKVVVLEDCPILREGDGISVEVTDVLTKFGIQPLELGLKLRAVYEGGLIFSGEVLGMDEKLATEQLQLACISAVNLAINANYPTGVTIGVMIANASAAARNLALNVCLPISEVVPTLLARAHAEMLGLAATGAKNERAIDKDLKEMLAIAPTGAKPETKSEDKPAEEKPKEEKREEELAGLGALFG